MILPKMFLPIGLALAFVSAEPQVASAYQIDCAILLCMAGGFPASAPCVAARAEMIRRITPWPIEPPLQIWRCPMHTKFPTRNGRERHFDILFRRTFLPPEASLSPVTSHWIIPIVGGSDTKISDPAFDFVRSIRVFENTYQQHRNHDGDCISWGNVRLGSYSEDGNYSRRRSSTGAIPEASDFSIPNNCGAYWHRSVFLEWRDYEGTYGHEEVHY